MRLEEAMKYFREPNTGAIDLSYENITVALADLERRNPARARRVRRALAPVYDKLFPRSRKGIEHSSYFRAIRVRFLAANPYFDRDVDCVRSCLGIPDWKLSDLEFADSFLPGLRPEFIEAAHLDTAAGWWVSVHRRTAKGWSLAVDSPPLPRWLIDSAVSGAGLASDAPALPSYLRGMPRVPARYCHDAETDVPLLRVAAKLVERYLLPWRAVYPVAFYVLTGAKKYLEAIPEFDVTWDWVESPLGRSLTVTVERIDEFTTRKQWLSVWDRHVSPRLSPLWQGRGETPHSKRPSTARFENSVYRELYQLFVREGLSPDEALEKLADKYDRPHDLPDRTTVQDLVEDFELLFNPERYNPHL